MSFSRTFTLIFCFALQTFVDVSATPPSVEEDIHVYLLKQIAI